jgi:putative phage-type endonuclease
VDAVISQRPITDRTSWLEWRKTFLGASEIAAAAGIDPWRSRLHLFMEKRGEIDPQPSNDAMERGLLLEVAAFNAMRKEHPEHEMIQPNVFIYDTETKLACTPDAWITNDESGKVVNVQIKCTSPASFDKWNGAAPIYYQLQCCCEAMLADAAGSILGVFLVDSWSARMRYFNIPRHPAAETRIRQIAAQFWADVDAGRMPPPDYARDAELVEKLFPPRPDIATVDLSGDNRLAEAIERRWKRKAYMKAAEDWCKSVEAEITHKLAGAERGVLPGWRISHKMHHTSGYTVPARDTARLRIAREGEG